MDNIIPDSSSYIAAMNTMSKSPVSATQFYRSPRTHQVFPSYDNGGPRQFNKNRGRGKFAHGQRHFQSRPSIPNTSHTSAAIPGVLGSYNRPSMSRGPVCQLCNQEGHTATLCGFRGYERLQCTICGKPNHTTWFCYYNEHGPNFVGTTSDTPAHSSPTQNHAMHAMHNVYVSPQQSLALSQV